MWWPMGESQSHPQQVLLWWPDSPVTLRPLGQWPWRQPSLREGRSWAAVFAWLHPGVLFTQCSICWCRHPSPSSFSSRISSRWQGDRMAPLFTGRFFFSEIPQKGSFLFPSTPSSGLIVTLALIVSVVPNIYPYCAWFVLLVFQTG